MRIGSLRHRVVIQRPVNDPLVFFGQPSQVVDIEPRDQETGEVIPVWSNVATVWAEVMPEKGTKAAEAFSANKETATATIVVRIRYRKDVDESMRVVWQGKNYQIHAVSDTGGKGIELQLVCSVVM